MLAPTPEKLLGIRSKIEWTKKHIADLDAAVRTFLDSHPYKVGTKRDPDTRKLIYYVTHVELLQGTIPQIAGDAIGNMVSVLDHLAFRLYLKSNPGGAGRHVYFPIGSNATSAAEYVTARQRKVQGIAPAVIAAIDALEPYKGGKGHQFWVLNELNNLAKHRDLITVGSQLRSVDLGAHITGSKWFNDFNAAHFKQFGVEWEPIIANAFFRPADRLCPLKAGDELLIDTPDAEPNDKTQFCFEVALNEPQIIQAESLVETVHQLAGLVDSIVSQFSSFL